MRDDKLPGHLMQYTQHLMVVAEIDSAQFTAVRIARWTTPCSLLRTDLCCRVLRKHTGYEVHYAIRSGQTDLVDSRTTKVVGSKSDSGFSPAMMRSRQSTRWAPAKSKGWRTVVSGGKLWAAGSTSS